MKELFAVLPGQEDDTSILLVVHLAPLRLGNGRRAHVFSQAAAVLARSDAELTNDASVITGSLGRQVGKEEPDNREPEALGSSRRVGCGELR